MFGRSEAQEARTLIIQHMRDCEIDKREIKDALKVQNDQSDVKHAQNIARMEKLENTIQTNFKNLMFWICTGLLTMVGSLILEIVKGLGK
ncbi:MAG TPA: hypothetical protein VIO57_10175 [Chloroflexota bacterium]|jgi:DNA-binding transcriptional MerR regulator